MGVKYPILFSMAIAILAASASLAEVKTDYDRTAEFSRYKTYSWKNVHTQNPLWADRIKADVASALAAKGWTEVESGGDVSIMAMEMTEDHRTLNTYYDNFGGGWGWRRWGGGFGDGFGTPTTTEETYKGGHAGRRLVRYQHQETDLARLGKRYAIRQIRQEHQEAQLGRAENVRSFPSGSEEVTQLEQLIERGSI
jgi:hypothetical protein